jgi:hypothetical protein
VALQTPCRSDRLAASRRPSVEALRSGRSACRRLSDLPMCGRALLKMVKLLLVLRPDPYADGRSAPADGAAVRGAPSLREEVVRPQRTIKGKKSVHFFPLSSYSARGSCGKTRVVTQNRWPKQNRGKWESRSARVAVGVRVARGRRTDGGAGGAVAGAGPVFRVSRWPEIGDLGASLQWMQRRR